MKAASAACLTLFFIAGSHAQVRPRDMQSDTWASTDALGRSLPGYLECGPRKPGRYVGIFYFLWMQPSSGQQLYDNSKLVAANPARPAYGPPGAFHWWGEPWVARWFPFGVYFTSKRICLLFQVLLRLSDGFCGAST